MRPTGVRVLILASVHLADGVRHSHEGCGYQFWQWLLMWLQQRDELHCIVEEECIWRLSHFVHGLVRQAEFPACLLLSLLCGSQLLLGQHENFLVLQLPLHSVSSSLLLMPALHTWSLPESILIRTSCICHLSSGGCGSTGTPPARVSSPRRPSSVG